MMTLTVRLQVLAFVVVSLVVLGYGATHLLPLGEVVHPPYTVNAEFQRPGGIYPRADVDLLGTRVGRVKELRPGPDGGTTVVMAIDHDVDIPADVTATIGSKSAIGEGFVELEPQTSGGELLGDGDTIPLRRTVSPPDIASLLGHLDQLAASVPLDDLATVLDQGATAVRDVAPDLERLIRNAHIVARSSVDSVEATTALIEDASTVLDTQVAVGSSTRTWVRELAGATDVLRELDPTFDQLFVNGLEAGSEVTDLLAANQDALPVLLNNLVVVNDIAADRIPGLRKTIVVLPWILEIGSTGVRYCDMYDARTGAPVANTCHYDAEGNPVFSAHLGAQLPEDPWKSPYHPCVRGYEGTVKYLPDGTPLRGSGARESRESDPNLDAHCAAPPTDPVSPNVRGAQNTHPLTTANRPAPFGLALWNPSSGLLATPDGLAYRLSGLTGKRPPSGDAGLGWLLMRPLVEGTR